MLFGWQMVGDTLKVASWLLGYILTAKAFVGLLIFSEIFFAALFFTLVNFAVPQWGLAGVSMAYAMNYFFHFLFMFFAVKSKKMI